jgi:hypothetical protein
MHQDKQQLFRLIEAIYDELIRMSSSDEKIGNFWKLNRNTPKFEVLMFIQTHFDDLAGYTSRIIQPRRKLDQKALDRIKNNGALKEDYMVSWYLEDKEYPVLRRYVELHELLRLYVIEYIELQLSETPSAPE